MCVLADRFALCHGGDHVAAEVLRVRARETDPLDSLDPIAGVQQLGEGPALARGQVAPVGVDVLT